MPKLGREPRCNGRDDDPPSDELTPPERPAEIAQGIADARRVVVPECGHLCSLEQPEAVTRALVELLAS